MVLEKHKKLAHPPLPWNGMIRGVSFLFFTMSMLVGSWLARLPEVQAKLQLSEAMLGVALLGMPIGALCGTQLSTYINARIGNSRACFWSAVLLCFTATLPPLSWNVWSLTAALAFFGLADGWLNVSMNAAAANLEERSKKTIMSSCHGMFSLGAMIGATTAGLIAGWGMALYLHILIIAILMLMALLAFRPFLLRLPNIELTPGSWSLPKKSMIGLAIVGCFIMVGEGAIADWSAIYLKSNLGSSLTLAALGFAGFSFMMAIGRFGGDRIRHIWPPNQLVRWGCIIGATGLFIAAIASYPLIAILGFTFTGIGFSIVVPIIFSLAAKTDPNNGITNIASVAIFGFLIAPPVIGFIGEHLGLRNAFGIMAALAFLAAFMSRTNQK